MKPFNEGGCAAAANRRVTGRESGGRAGAVDYLFMLLLKRFSLCFGRLRRGHESAGRGPAGDGFHTESG